VDDVGFVSVLHPACNRFGDFGAVFGGLRLAVQVVPERPAGTVLHHEVGSGFVLADVVDRSDLRVIHARHRLGLGGEPAALGVVGLDADDLLEGDELGAADVVHQPDLAHTPFAQPPNKLIPRNALLRLRGCRVLARTDRGDLLVRLRDCGEELLRGRCRNGCRGTVVDGVGHGAGLSMGNRGAEGGVVLDLHDDKDQWEAGN